MGKRSSFERVARDFYPTPARAVAPLLPHLAPGTRFVEPCAGAGDLIDHLTAAGHVCVGAYDVEPRDPRVTRLDARLGVPVGGADAIVTNPPWSRPLLHELIAVFAHARPTWLLFDADWIHTQQSAPLQPWLRAVVSVGRVQWIAGSPHTGKDNAAWYLFDARGCGPAVIYGRVAA